MFSSELSDEQVLYQRSKWSVSERVLEPLEMSDTEILDWLNEYCNGVNVGGIGGWFVHYDGITYLGQTIREATCNAAAHQREANRDF